MTQNDRSHPKIQRRTPGFTLIELMVVLAILAVVAVIAIPRFLTSRVSANENAAIATLRTIAAAQQQLQASAAIDTDGDGNGEYGYFGELAGSALIRVWSASGVQLSTTDRLDPSYLPQSFTAVVPDANAAGVVQRQGYYFRMILPQHNASGEAIGVSEVARGGSDPGALPSSSAAEQVWTCYAWPVQAGKTGVRAFCINQEAEVIACANRDGQYGGIAIATATPAYEAAYTTTDMHSVLGLARAGLAAMDGHVWTPVGN